MLCLCVKCTSISQTCSSLKWFLTELLHDMTDSYPVYLSSGNGRSNWLFFKRCLTPTSLSFIHRFVHPPAAPVISGRINTICHALLLQTAGFCTGSVHGDPAARPEVTVSCEMFKIEVRSSVEKIAPICSCVSLTKPFLSFLGFEKKNVWLALKKRFSSKDSTWFKTLTLT